MASLSRLCENYIVEHLEEFLVSHLSLLPLSKRRDLLWRLPIADVCLRLENTDFVKGLDMAAYWKLPCENPLSITVDNDIERYIKGRWPSEAEYAKAMLYGQVVECQMGYHIDFRLPGNGRLPYTENLIPFLYGIRKLHHHRCRDECNCLTLPSRYSSILSKPYSILNPKRELQIIDAVMHCFRGERPKIVRFGIQLDISDPQLCFLSEVEYVCLYRDPERSFQWVIELMNMATNLQVLVLQCPDDEMINLDFFCAICPQFWSKFRILKIVSAYPEMAESDRDRQYRVSQHNLNQLIIAYFSTPTDHPQLVHFSDMVIECRDTDSVSAIEQTYVQFKNIKISNCCFVSKPTTKALSNWLGRNVDVLEKEENTDSILFQVGRKGSFLRKRKHSENADYH
jgi:hypothetical protein